MMLNILIFVEAAGDRVAYARAVSDYNNQFDDTSLTFKVGDTIAVCNFLYVKYNFPPPIFYLGDRVVTSRKWPLGLLFCLIPKYLGEVAFLGGVAILFDRKIFFKYLF